MSSTKTDTDSSVIFMGEQHIVQLHPDQEERLQDPANFVQNTQSSRVSVEASDIDVTTVQETQVVTSIPETQNTGKLLQTHIKYFIQSKTTKITISDENSVSGM